MQVNKEALFHIIIYNQYFNMTQYFLMLMLLKLTMVQISHHIHIK
jgi:hypothetical protein